MTHDEFAGLVGRLEGEARARPALYQARVLGLALLGNAYLGAILLLIAFLLFTLLASVVFLKALAIKLALVVGAFLWVILKALWIRIDPPQGTPLDARQSPALFALIEELRRKLGAPRFHHVLLTDEFNAGVVQRPRLGIFGWPANYLLIGLPLMKSLSVEQFKAVLAHEFGHLAKGHGRLSNWLYRQRLRWGRLLDALEPVESKGLFLFKPFLKRFAPYFNAYSFPLARANEYEADATAARLTSPRAAAEALTSVHVVGSFLNERYWPQIHGQADEQAHPAFAPFAGMTQGVATDVEPQAAQAWLERAMAETTTLEDTHPSLADRLRGIGEAPRFAAPSQAAAADRLLGAALAPLTAAFDRRWQDGIAAVWEARHREVQQARQQLTELDGKAQSGVELTVQEAFDRALLTESTAHDADAALEQLRALHARSPDDTVVAFALGARLLRRDDADGVALVERAAARDARMTARAAEQLRDYHWRAGREDAARNWHARLVDRVTLEQAAEKERSGVTLADKFEVNGLDTEARAALVAQLRAVPGLRKAYFVRKRVANFPERPCYVLGYTVSSWFTLLSKQRVAAVLQAIQETVAFPGETLILNVEGGNYRFGRRFFWMRGARVV